MVQDNNNVRELEDKLKAADEQRKKSELTNQVESNQPRENDILPTA